MADFKSILRNTGGLALSVGKAGATVTKAGADVALDVIHVIQTGTTRAAAAAAKNKKRTAAIAGTSTAIVVAGGATTAVVLGKKRDFHFAGKTHSGVASVYNIKDEAGVPVRVLKVGGVYQSATYLSDDEKYRLPFAYYRAFDVVFQEGIKHDRLLMLGGGGCTFPKHVLAEDNTTCIDVIEPDTAMTRIAREYFFLDEAISQFDANGTRLHVIAEDGAHFLARRAALTQGDQENCETPKTETSHLPKISKKFIPTCPANTEVPLRFDAVINDAFNGGRPCAGLLTHEAIANAKACLNDGGLYLVNVADPGKNDVNLRQTMMSLSSVFSSVHVIPCADEVFGAKDCCLVIATDGDYVFPGETQVQTSNL